MGVMRKLAFTGMALCAVLGNVAHAQTTVGFTVASQQFELTTPDDFCAPVGEELQVSQTSAKVDEQNFTPVDLQRCGTFGMDYMLVKYPREGAVVDMSKADFLKAMGDFFDTERGRRAADAGFKDSRDNISRGSGGAVDVDATGVSYAGKDSDCVYLGGRIDLIVEGETKRMLLGSCMTVVNNTVITVHSYRIESEASVDALKARSRTVARSLRAL